MIRKGLIFLLFISLFFSCVTKKKYNELNSRKSKLEAEKADCDEQLKTAQAEIERLTQQLNNLNQENAKLKEDSTVLGEDLRRITKSFNSLNQSYEKLIQTHDKLKSSSAESADKLSKDLAKREKQLLEKENEANELKKNLEEREKRVKELEKVLADKEKAVTELKEKVQKALLNFKEKDLTINIKNGKVYVSLAEQLLFKSGSTEVDPKGVEALKKLAEVLKDQKDVSVMVEGHTDDVPISKGTANMKDNWDLSVLRATSIVRILTNSGVNPINVVPSGRGEFSPVAEGKSAEARQKNRRTEIILTPNLDELFKILDNQ